MVLIKDQKKKFRNVYSSLSGAKPGIVTSKAVSIFREVRNLPSPASMSDNAVFNKNKYSMATTIFNVYMVWGGTNWGR